MFGSMPSSSDYMISGLLQQQKNQQKQTTFGTDYSQFFDPSIFEFIGADFMESMADATGWEEAQELRAKLLADALKELNTLKSSPALGVMTSGMEQFTKPNSLLRQSQEARIKTGASEQMRALEQNAAAASIPVAQDAMLRVMQNATDAIAQLPASNLLAGSDIASKIFAAQSGISTSIANANLGTNVEDLSTQYMQALGMVGSALGNFFPQLYNLNQQLGYLGGIR